MSDGRTRERPPARYGKIVVMLAIFIVLLMIYNRASRRGTAGRLLALAEAPAQDFSKIKRYSEAEGQAIVADAAGFWESIAADSTKALTSIDRLELKDNGIIWKVVRYRLRLPSGDILPFMHIAHAFIRPYGRFPHEERTAVCEARTIRQVAIAGADTCFGPSQADHLWRLNRTADTLRLEGKCYVPFRSTALDTFFPRGNVLGLIDRVSLDDCQAWKADFKGYFRSALNSALGEIQQDRREPRDAEELISRYFEPLFLRDTLAALGAEKSGRSDSLTVYFQISWQGLVLAAKTQDESRGSGKFRETILAETRTWVFPKLVSEQPPTRVAHVFRF
jgi:hypothetical protein